jgi:hypothetical protein
MPVILAAQELTSEGSWFEASLGKIVRVPSQTIAGRRGAHLQFQASQGKKIHETSSQQKKSWEGGVCLSSN